MKSLLFLLLAISLAAQAKDQLHLYTWADYIKPELVARFEAAHKCKVVIDTFDPTAPGDRHVTAGATLTVPGRSVIVLQRTA